MGSMLALGTLKNSSFFFSSSSFSDRAARMKLTCSTIHPGRCIVLLSADLKDAYCSSAKHLAVGDVRHALEFHQADHARFGFRGQFKCNAVRSFIPYFFIPVLRSFRVELLPFFSFLPLGSDDASSPFLLPCSTVFAPRNDQRPLEILQSALSTVNESIVLH